MTKEDTTWAIFIGWIEFVVGSILIGGGGWFIIFWFVLGSIPPNLESPDYSWWHRVERIGGGLYLLAVSFWLYKFTVIGVINKLEKD